MAKVDLSLIFELEPLHDAIGELGRLHRALARCHGERYRDMEDKIERMTEKFPSPISHVLNDGRYILQAPEEVASILRQARQWGVI